MGKKFDVLLKIGILILFLSGCSSLGKETKLDSSEIKEEAETGTPDKQAENFAKESDASALPAYVYNGEDPYMKGICNYLVSLNEGKEGTDVYIPVPVIIDIEETGEEKLVYGIFWSYWYNLKNGNLFCDSGGEETGLIHMKQEGQLFNVISFEKTGEGSYYAEDLKKLCEGREGLYEQFIDRDIREKRREEIRKELITGYVNEHALDVESYQDYGWEPVKLMKNSNTTF